MATTVTLRDDVRELRWMADGLTVGWAPSVFPKWTTSEGGQLAWLIVILWKRYAESARKASGLEARVAHLEREVDGLRTTNERLTDLLDPPPENRR